MRKVWILCSVCLLALGGALACKDVEVPAELADQPAGLYAWLDTNRGPIVARLFPDKAPIAVANFTGLANAQHPFFDTRQMETRSDHYFDGLIFHRVVRDFVIQGGDPHANGTGGPGYKFKSEVDPELKFEREGMLAMANSGPDTNGSQFFFTLKPLPDLNGRFTIFGEVVAGMDVVKTIGESPINRFQPERPIRTVKIKHVRVFSKDEAGKISEAQMQPVDGLPQPAAPAPPSQTLTETPAE